MSNLPSMGFVIRPQPEPSMSGPSYVPTATPPQVLAEDAYQTYRFYVKEDDVSNHIKETSESIIIISPPIIPLGMVGENMFGSYGILGAGYKSTFITGVPKFVLFSDISKNIRKTTATYNSVTLTVAPHVWGKAMFGSNKILGAGTFSVVQG